VRRVAVPPPPESLGSAATERERTDVLEFYADPDNRTKKYRRAYTAYTKKDIKAALDAAFHGKCAYCESKIEGTQPLAVEHYRPKGAVMIDGDLTPPGYYWLASNWANLLPSCTDCNSPRGQDFPLGLPATAGKANQFPLASETSRATMPGGEDTERRLLLHPYLDEPSEHLEFVWRTGTIEDGEVRPRGRGSSRRPSRKGRASIEVYALQRLGLVSTRRAHLHLLLAHLEHVRQLKAAVARHPDDDELRADFVRAVDEVALFTDETKPYSAMCRQVVAEFGGDLFSP
jgi:uncharacterized protein (TIGR02646 family)